jgi:hypothetical protein
MKINILKTILTGVVAGVLVLLADGCAARPERMQAGSFAVQNKQPFSISVQTEGGHQTNPLGSSDISNEAFAQAIQESISKSGVFRSVVASSNGDYLLEVGIIDVDKPAAGFDMTVTMTVNWKLTHVATKKIVFQNVTHKSHTATVGDAFAGTARLRLAEEGAARENIEEGLHRISLLELQGNE